MSADDELRDEGGRGLDLVAAAKKEQTGEHGFRLALPSADADPAWLSTQRDLTTDAAEGKLDPLVGEFEMVLVLAVNPGWGGQKFIASTCERVKRLREMLGDTALICVDGGVTRDNIGNIAGLGADIEDPAGDVGDLQRERYCRRRCGWRRHPSW